MVTTYENVGRRRSWGDLVMGVLTLTLAAIVLCALAGLLSMAVRHPLCETTTNHAAMPCGR